MPANSSMVRVILVSDIDIIMCAFVRFYSWSHRYFTACSKLVYLIKDTIIGLNDGQQGCETDHKVQLAKGAD
jgi:hypothetical protein